MLFCPQRSMKATLALASTLTFVLAGMSCAALEPATPLSKLARQSWSMENGLPQNTVTSLLQSRDGYLWAGTELGLARFDGTGFTTFDHTTAPEFPDAEVRCVLDANGTEPNTAGLWIGTGDGLVHFRNGLPGLLTARNGLPSNSIRGLAQTSDGTLWVWTELGLARWNGQQFDSATNQSGLDHSGINSFAADGAGRLWVGTSSGLAVFDQGKWYVGEIPGNPAQMSVTGSKSLAQVGPAGDGQVLVATSSGVFLARGRAVSAVLPKSGLPSEGISFLNQLPDGTIAIASKTTLVLARPAGRSTGNPELERLTVSRQLPGSRIEAIYADREGCLWMGTNRGMARISPRNNPAMIQMLPASDPLAGTAVVSFLEDREGDLWVGTETAGLHIFRDARFQTIGSSEGLSSDATTAIVEDAQKTVWIGTRDSGLNQITRPAADAATSPSALSVKNLTARGGLFSDIILALAAAPNGDLWVGTPDGLNCLHHAGSSMQITSFTSADGLPDDFIRSLLVAPDGSLWVGTRRGLTHLDHGRFQTFTQRDGLGSDLVGALAGSADGDLWIATLNGLSRLHGARIHNYTTADGLSSNVITALEVGQDQKLWIGTQGDGLNLFDGQRFLPIRESASMTGAPQSNQLPAAIHSVLLDERGHLWLGSDTGLTRVDVDSVLACAYQRQCGLNAYHFTTADGLRSRETSSNSHPTASRASDGRLWFTTPKGVVIVDPLHFAPTPGAPPVVIERFSVDDSVWHGDSERIPAGRMRFQFDYAGLSFAAPQKVRYQYMLEGFDHVWTEAGARRTAYYTNIPPGKYRFRVQAAIGDSGFAKTENAAEPLAETDLAFELLPHIYQTLWFRILIVLALLALTILVFRRRLLRVRREFNAVMAERNRIAREIHDTLAQGYVGISIQLEVLGELLRHGRAEAATKHLALTQGLVREGLEDARQSIWTLRSQDAGEHTLPVRIGRLVEKANDAQITASLAVHGAYRPLASEFEREVLRIAQEAIQNAKRHAVPSLITVQLDYDQRALMVTITDDGKGFVLQQKNGRIESAKPGHYGLTGMQERAALIHAELTIASEPGAGTTVSLKVNAPEASPQSKRGRAAEADAEAIAGQKHS